MKRVAFWFRRDLRIEDNCALHHAINSGAEIIPVFIFDSNIIDELPKNDARITFIYQQLTKLNTIFQDMGGGMNIYIGDPTRIWSNLIDKYDLDGLFYNRDYEPYARDRDKQVYELFNNKKLEVHSFKDHVIFEPQQVLKDDGTPYTVFTPYKRKWLSKFNRPEAYDCELRKTTIVKLEKAIPKLEAIGFEKSAQSVPDFHLDVVEEYAAKRNTPAIDGTSKLGPHLRFGTIGIRTIVQNVMDRSETFLSELIWREFFQQIIFHFPHVVNSNFRAKYDGVKWRNNEEDFKKWCEGKTGYPMVDAGMRELNETGFMHNRVRMITAGFLCKHLLIDWRWGEVYFAEKLLDFELAANNGNWQWAAGTGCDAAPYFRVFNPSEQLKKFDKDMAYVKKWIPELLTEEYPQPMVDHKFARERAIDTYKKGIAG
jgi:deoxyribodipyrimidine photo-lyase